MSRILTSVHGNRLGLDEKNRVIAPNGLRLGSHGNQFDDPSPQCVVLLDDFVGKLQSDVWTLLKGSDGGCVNFAAAAGPNGIITGTTGAAAGGTGALNGVAITGALQFQAQAGSLEFQTSFYLSAITNISVFAGLTNQVSAITPAVVAAGGGNGFTFNANDCVGFLYDTSMTTKDWWCVGQAGGTPATGQDSKVAPVAATVPLIGRNTLRVSVDNTGIARFFINGIPVGQTMAGAVTKTVNLAPVLNVFTRTAASATVTCDYIHCSSTRY